MPVRALLPILLFTLSACTRGEAAPEREPLAGTVVAAGDFLGQPSDITIAGNHLVVTDRSAPFVHVLSVAAVQLPLAARRASTRRGSRALRPHA